ncbi:MAG: Rpn family recombination-promoting nuclease/putative transposase [Alphaproteobacteria bacterium]|jgi:predicted transposase/invertase (TIGR01784 family)|nr:Rpn family recombination-promoting nuclease/putative transposase [Alphaproteobacteria bacterium]
MKYTKRLLVSFLLILGSMFSSFEANSTGLRGLLPLIEDAVGLLSNRTHRAIITKPVRSFHSTPSLLKDTDDKKAGQIFGIPTYDSAFRHMLTADDVRLDFVQTFAQNLDIVSTEPLDHNLAPIKDFTALRDILNTKQTASVMHRIRKGELYVVETKSVQKHNGATQVFDEFAHHFNDLRDAFPRPLKAAQMDLACRLSDGHFAIAEVQVVPQDFWDRRALAYAALYFGRQLRSGDDWGELRKVIAINILGGGKDDKRHWVDTPKEVIRHYKFIDALNPSNVIDGIELIQCSVLNEGDIADPRMREWVELFREAHHKSWDDVDKVKSPVIREAYERLRMDKFPPNVMREYEKNDKEFSRYSGHTTMLVEEGREEGREEGVESKAKAIATNMLNEKYSAKEISRITGLSVEEIEKL